MRRETNCRSGLALLVFLFVPLFVPIGRAQAPQPVQLFDTVARSSVPLKPDALAKQDRWKLIPEDQTRHKFKGDVVFSNGRLVVVLRQKGRGAEVYAMTPKGPAMRAELVGVGAARTDTRTDTRTAARTAMPTAARATALSSVKIVENNSGSVVVDATFKAAKGESFTLGYDLKLGQVFVETRPRSGVAALQVEAPCRFAVLPDFFADDIVADAAELPVSETELPSENFLLHMLSGGEAIVMAVWHPAGDDVRIMLDGHGPTRAIRRSEIPYGKDGKVCVAVLNGSGTWHTRNIASDDADKIIPLDWKAPYIAHWRVDWRRDDKLTDSWEMMTQKPDGQYVRHGWYGQPDSFGQEDWLAGGRERWTTVLGRFQYPCWIDKDCKGHLQPLKKGLRFQGPALIYPINRLDDTPLEEFTVVDIMRATLGVGPCEYILDVEGQKRTYEGRPTCACRDVLNDIYTKKEQKERRDDVLKALDDVTSFVRHIRGRIEQYIAFGHEMSAWFEEQKKKQNDLAPFIAEMQGIIRGIDDYAAKRKDRINTPEYASQLVNDFRTNLVDYEGQDAEARCKKITAAIVQIGGAQDELVGECRMVVKMLRQRAALAMAVDPRVAPVAKEIRRRTQEMLRNPTSYEAPRH